MEFAATAGNRRARHRVVSFDRDADLAAAALAAASQSSFAPLRHARVLLRWIADDADVPPVLDDDPGADLSTEVAVFEHLALLLERAETAYANAPSRCPLIDLRDGATIGALLQEVGDSEPCMIRVHKWLSEATASGAERETGARLLLAVAAGRPEAVERYCVDETTLLRWVALATTPPRLRLHATGLLSVALVDRGVADFAVRASGGSTRRANARPCAHISRIFVATSELRSGGILLRCAMHRLIQKQQHSLVASKQADISQKTKHNTRAAGKRARRKITSTKKPKMHGPL